MKEGREEKPVEGGLLGWSLLWAAGLSPTGSSEERQQSCPYKDGLTEAAILWLPSWVASGVGTSPRTPNLCTEVDGVGSFPGSERWVKVKTLDKQSVE